MVITAIKFKKRQGFNWETGIKIEGSLGSKIIDSQGQEVKLASQIETLPYSLCLDLKPILNDIKQKLK